MDTENAQTGISTVVCIASIIVTSIFFGSLFTAQYVAQDETKDTFFEAAISISLFLYAATTIQTVNISSIITNITPNIGTNWQNFKSGPLCMIQYIIY